MTSTSVKNTYNALQVIYKDFPVTQANLSKAMGYTYDVISVWKNKGIKKSEDKARFLVLSRIAQGDLDPLFHNSENTSPLESQILRGFRHEVLGHAEELVPFTEPSDSFRERLLSVVEASVRIQERALALLQ